MKKFWIQFTILTLVVLAALYVFYNPDTLGFLTPNRPQTLNQTLLKIGDTVVNTEVADTPDKRGKGLGNRESIASDSGMLFIFESSKKYQFWMKGLKFPLDFIFIRDGKVVDLLRNIDPPTSGQDDSALPVYEPVVPIDMTLEVNKGFIDAHNIRIGDTVFLMK